MDSSDRLHAAFRANFADRKEVGASLVVFHGSSRSIDLHHGFADRDATVPWTENTLVPFWSATKGLAAAVVLLALHRAGLSPASSLLEVWPALHGPARPTVGHLLSHRGGLAALDQPVPLSDYDAVITAIEAQARHPETASTSASHAYHPRTFGFITDELVRRLTGGIPLGTFFQREIAEPLDLDLWIGLPSSKDHRVARILPGRARPAAERDPLYDALADPASLSRRAFNSPSGLHAISDMNQPDTWRLSLPALGGVGSARSLAQFYAVLATGGTWNARVIFPEPVCRWAETTLSNGPDAVLLTPTSFSAGFQKDPVDASGRKLRSTLGPSTRAFGHPGAGGSLAFADPENGIAFAYLMNQMELSVLPTLKAQSLVEAVYTLSP